MPRERQPKHRQETFGMRVCNFPGCQKPFEALARHQIYCSQTCRHYAFVHRQAEKKLSSIAYATPLGVQNTEIDDAMKKAKEATSGFKVSETEGNWDDFMSSLEKSEDSDGSK